MKAIIISTIGVFGFIASLFLSSCGGDPCKKMVCAHSGVCKESKCVCQVGYEGTLCETITRDKFIGIYNVNEDGTLSGVAQYVINITPGDKINEVKISNFQNFFTTPVVGTCKSDTITIVPQVMPNGSVVDGWGYISDISTLNDHYYKHAVVTLYYKVVNTAGQSNEYGYPNGNPSIYTK